MRGPTVSVCITAYNHGAFLGQALESVLAQETDFPLQVVVGEDGSNDNTRAVLERYAAENDCILPIYRDGKDKIYVGGKPTGRRNLIDILEHRVQGKYVAMLDGDDYWTDPAKLHKQACILETQPDIAVVGHRVLETDDDHTEGVLFPARKKYPPGRYSTAELIGANFLPTASVMFRREEGFRFPAWMYTLAFADWPLHLYNSARGDIILLDDAMAVRRKHDGGRWSAMTAAERFTNDVRFLHSYRKVADRRYHATIDRSVRSAQRLALRDALEHDGLRGGVNLYAAATELTDTAIPASVFLTAYCKSSWKTLKNRFRRRKSQ